MKIKEILTESLSRIVYHYTNLHAASKIMQSGEFELSSSIGARSEENFAPKDYPYFLSTTRTILGGYHEYVSSGAVMFVLDGNWFNQHYKSKSVDYWGNRDPLKSHHKDHEAEDRVFSKSPTIPIDGVTAIHVYSKPPKNTHNEHMPETKAPAWARTVLIEAKKRGIPAYLYESESAWRALDTRKSVPITKRPSLIGQQDTRSQTPRNKGYLRPWLELLQATNSNQLGEKAQKLRIYSLNSDYDKHNAVGGLSTEMGNARKPNSGIDRENAVKIINFMQKNRIATIKDLVNFIAEKWKNQP
jgi:hypothetical protein